MVWATSSLEDGRRQLDGAISARLREEPIQEAIERVRFPIAFLFVRGDRAGAGRDLAEQVVASFGYWNRDSGKYFDVLFPGWGKDGDVIVFDPDSFLRFRAELESICRWSYSGETDLLLTHYDYLPAVGSGDFAFDQCVYLPVEVMIRDGRIANLDALLHELVSKAKETWPRLGGGMVWSISGQMALDRGRTAVWDWIKGTLLKDAGRVYDALRPFAVCDLSR